MTTVPEFPAVVVEDAATTAGATDATDLDGILADDVDMEARRQAIVKRHAMDAGGPVMLALARMAALTDAMGNEVRLIRLYLGGE